MIPQISGRSPNVAAAQNSRRRVPIYSGHNERLLESVGGDSGPVARESKTRLDAISTDHLARNHLKMALLLPVPTADVAAIKSNHGRFIWLRRGRLDRVGAMGCTTSSATRNVLFRTVPPFRAPSIGSNSDSRAATLPNGARGDHLRQELDCKLLGPRKPEPEVRERACSLRSRHAISTSLVKPGSNSAASFTRRTIFGTNSPASREPKTYPSRNKPHRIACSPTDRRFPCDSVSQIAADLNHSASCA
jgi:hypothetical protein